MPASTASNHSASNAGNSNASSTTISSPSSSKKSPSDFLQTVLGQRVVVRLSNGTDYKGKSSYSPSSLPLSLLCPSLLSLLSVYSLPGFAFSRLSVRTHQEEAKQDQARERDSLPKRAFSSSLFLSRLFTRSLSAFFSLGSDQKGRERLSVIALFFFLFLSLSLLCRVFLWICGDRLHVCFVLGIKNGSVSNHPLQVYHGFSSLRRWLASPGPLFLSLSLSCPFRFSASMILSLTRPLPTVFACTSISVLVSPYN